MEQLIDFWPIGIVVGGWVISVEVRSAVTNNNYKHIKEQLDKIVKKLYNGTE